MNYPSKFSNDPRCADDVLRDMSLLNQPAGCIEFVNTKGEETISFAHKNGTYFRYDKFGREELVTREERKHVMGNSLEHIQGNRIEHYDQGVEKIILGDEITKVGDPEKWQPLIEKFKKKIEELHDDQRLFEIQRTKKHNSIDQSPLQIKDGVLAPCPTDAVIGKFLKTEVPSQVLQLAIKGACVRTIFEFEPTEDIYEEIPVVGGINCFTCWGTAFSPSSQDGVWTKEAAKAQIKAKREKLQKELYDIEKQLGQVKNPSGGTSIQNISKDMILNVGLAFNDLESFRRDPKGKLVPYGIKIDPLGGSVYTQYRESPLVEVVDVERFPGGSYEINANHNYRVTAGSGGIDFKTTGMMDLYSPILNVASETILFNSRGEIALGAERLDFSGDIITLRPNKVTRHIEDAAGGIADLPANAKNITEPEQQVLVDGNLNVAMNAIVRGGMHVEGEVSLHHITAPLEYHITESDFEIEIQPVSTVSGPCAGMNVGVIGEEKICVPTVIKDSTHADILGGHIIGSVIVPDVGCLPVFSVCAPNSVLVHPHYHTFKSLPMKLMEGGEELIKFEVTVGNNDKLKDQLMPHDAVRAVGARNNFANIVLAQPVKDSTTPTTVVEKFGGKCDALVIDNTSWGEKNRNDDKPKGEGVATSNYTPEDMMQRIQMLEKQLEQMYIEVKKQLESPSSQNPTIA